MFVPISIRFEFNRQETVLRAIATRLAAIHDEPAFADSVDDWRDLIAELMVRAPPPGTRVLVVLDGLDEADGWHAGASLWPNPPHCDVKLIVSARLTATHPQTDDWMRELGWSQRASIELGPLTVEGVRNVVRHMGSRLRSFADDPATVARLHEISAGDPLVVGLYVSHLWANPPLATDGTLDSLAKANPGLEGFMDLWWNDQERLCNDPAERANRRHVFDLLACAFGPLERSDLLGLARHAQAFSGADLDAVLGGLDRLVVTPSPRAYAVAHPRLLEYRLRRLREDGDLESLERCFLEWAEECAARMGRPPRYAVLHYGQHLQRAEADPDRMTVLLSPGWRSAWLMVADDLTGWVDDIGRVHAVAARADAAAIAAQTRAQWPALRAWCTCLRADAGATYDLVDGAFAGALVRRGLWSERRALTHCARVENPWFRAEHLAALAPALSLDGARLAAQIVRTLGDADDEPAAEAMVAVVARLVAEGDLSAATALAADSESPSVRAAGLVATFPALSDAGRLEALRRLNDEGSAPHLTQLAPRIDRELARRVFGDPPRLFLEPQLRGNVAWWSADADLDAPGRADALSLLAPWMTSIEREQQVAACLDALAAYGSPYGVDRAVAALAPHLQSPAWHRARAIAHDLLREVPQWQLLAEISLLPYAPPGVGESLLKDLATSVPELLEHVSPNDVAEALSTLAANGASTAVLDALSELDQQNWEKADFLASVAPHLDLSGVHRAFEIAANTRRETRQPALVALLSRQAECGEAEAALAGTSTRNDPDEVSAALAVLHVASGRDSFSKAVNALETIEDRSLRCAATAVAAHLSPPTAADLWRVVWSFGDPIDYATDVLPMEAFELVSGAILDEELASADMVRTGQYMVDRGLHPRKDQIMVEHFRRLAEVHGIEAALERGRAYSTDTFDMPLAWAAAGVASRLEPGTGLDPFDLVWAATSSQAVVMAATLGLLPPAERPSSLGIAVEMFGPPEIRFGSAGLLLGAVPEELYEIAASALIPDALLDGQGRRIFSLDIWAANIAGLCSSLDAERLRRLHATSQLVRSGSARAELTVAIAVRLAVLGQIEQALACADQLDHEHAAAVLQQMAEVVPRAMIPRLAEEIQSRVPYSYWRGPRALAAARLGRRIGELPLAELSDLLDQWHTRAPDPGEVLVDLLFCGPAILALGGRVAAADLVDRLEERLTTTTGVAYCS